MSKVRGCYYPKTSADRYLRKIFGVLPGKYGAPMGQPDSLCETDDDGYPDKDKPLAKTQVELSPVTMYDGGYTTCGAYFGGNSPGGILWLAFDRKSGYHQFLRAAGELDAKRQLIHKYGADSVTFRAVKAPKKSHAYLTISDNQRVY